MLSHSLSSFHQETLGACIDTNGNASFSGTVADRDVSLKPSSSLLVPMNSSILRPQASDPLRDSKHKHMSFNQSNPFKSRRGLSITEIESSMSIRGHANQLIIRNLGGGSVADLGIRGENLASSGTWGAAIE